jgi:AraC family transcriptional regulator
VKLPSWPVLIGIAALAVLGVVISIMLRLGSFKPVVIERKSANAPLVVLLRDHLGAYHKIATVITDVEIWARANGEPCKITFGQYFDNPEQVDEDRLKSRGGCVLSSPESIENLKKRINEGTESGADGESKSGLKIDTIEIPDALIAEFDGAPSLGPIKVYPKVFEMMKQLDLQSSGPVLELYEVTDVNAGRTRYIFPVETSRK